MLLLQLKILLCRIHLRENAPLEGEPVCLAPEILEAYAVGEHRRGRLRHGKHAESAVGHAYNKYADCSLTKTPIVLWLCR